MPTPYDFYFHQIIHHLALIRLSPTTISIPPSTAWVPIKALHLLSKFDIRNTLPLLQHDFSALWNEIVLSAQNDASKIFHTYILAAIRHIHNALRQGTDTDPIPFPPIASLDSIPYDPSLYPLCENPSHPSRLRRYTQEMTVGEMADPPVAVLLPSLTRIKTPLCLSSLPPFLSLGQTSHYCVTSLLQ
jgi:hypothetical protein